MLLHNCYISPGRALEKKSKKTRKRLKTWRKNVRNFNKPESGQKLASLVTHLKRPEIAWNFTKRLLSMRGIDSRTYRQSPKILRRLFLLLVRSIFNAESKILGSFSTFVPFFTGCAHSQCSSCVALLQFNNFCSTFLSQRKIYSIKSPRRSLWCPFILWLKLRASSRQCPCNWIGLFVFFLLDSFFSVGVFLHFRAFLNIKNMHPGRKIQTRGMKFLLNCWGRTCKAPVFLLKVFVGCHLDTH